MSEPSDDHKWWSKVRRWWQNAQEWEAVDWPLAPVGAVIALIAGVAFVVAVWPEGRLVVSVVAGILFALSIAVAAHAPTRSAPRVAADLMAWVFIGIVAFNDSHQVIKGDESDSHWPYVPAAVYFFGVLIVVVASIVATLSPPPPKPSADLLEAQRRAEDAENRLRDSEKERSEVQEQLEVKDKTIAALRTQLQAATARPQLRRLRSALKRIVGL